MFYFWSNCDGDEVEKSRWDIFLLSFFLSNKSRSFDSISEPCKYFDYPDYEVCQEVAWLRASILLSARSSRDATEVVTTEGRSGRTQLQRYSQQVPRGPFLENPGNFSGPEIKYSTRHIRIRARILATKLLHFVSLADSSIIVDARLLKPGSLGDSFSRNGPQASPRPQETSSRLKSLGLRGCRRGWTWRMEVPSWIWSFLEVVFLLSAKSTLSLFSSRFSGM